MKLLVIGTVCMCNLLLAGCVAYDPGYDRSAYTRRDNDRDGDGVRNSRDRDRDGDGVPNRADQRPNNPRWY